VCLQSQTEAQRTDGEFRRRLTHRNQAIPHSMTPSDKREEGVGGGDRSEEELYWGGDGGERSMQESAGYLLKKEEGVNLSFYRGKRLEKKGNDGKTAVKDKFK